MKKHLIATIAALTAATALMGQTAFAAGKGQDFSRSQEEQKAQSDAKGATMISEIFGDGQKITYIAVEYPGEVAPGSISPDDYHVENRTVEAVFTSDKAQKTEVNTPGNYVILKLNVMSPTINFMLDVPDGRPDMKGNVIETVSVEQTKEIQGTDGTIYKAGEIPTQGGGMGSSGIHLVRDDFETDHWYADENNGATIHYALFSPEGYDSGAEQKEAEKYPLVVFISHETEEDPENNPYTALTQGDGAIAFARDEFQKDHPCFVAAVLLQEKVVNDYFEYKPEVDSLLGMVDDLCEKYPVDENRIYLTGQSNGGMTTFLMASKEPDRFAAILQVASQWDPEVVTQNLKDMPIFMIASEADTKAPYYDDQIADLFDAEGIPVTRRIVSGQSTAQEFLESVSEMAAQGTDKLYMKFAAGTVRTELDGTPITIMGGADHMGTWKIAYDIPLVKEWIFSQSLDTRKSHTAK